MKNLFFMPTPTSTSTSRSGSGSSKLRGQPLGALMWAGVSAFALGGNVWGAEDADGGSGNSDTELPAVRIEALDEKPRRLLRDNSRTGKQLQDPHDVPQASTTVTHELMEAQNTSSLRDALRNVAGLSFNAAEGGRSGDNMSLRGFYTFGDMYLDGIRDTAQYNRESFNLEQVDVLRGAASMLFGRGQAGGVINQVSKTPLPYEATQLSGSMGSYDHAEGRVDFNKPISADTAVRINAMQRDEGSWRSNPANGAGPALHRKGLALGLAMRQQSDNPLWFNYYEAQNRDNPDYGIAFDPATRAPNLQLPADYFWGTAATFDNSSTRMSTFLNDARLGPAARLRTQLRSAHYERSYWAKTPRVAQLPDAQGSVGSNKTRASRYDTLTLQTDYTTAFNLGGKHHAWLGGFEFLRENSSRNALYNFGTAGNPDFRPDAALPDASSSRFQGDSYGLYVQDTMDILPRWKTTLGVRRDWLDARYSTMTSPRLNYSENSYRAALSFHPQEDRHYYLAWSNAFSPTADLYQLSITPLPAERSDVWELGAKWMLWDGDLALRGALYQATKYWERSGDLESTAAVLSKKRQTWGMEWEAAGRLSDRLELFAGVALMDARILEVAENADPNTGHITRANPGYAGQRARNAAPFGVNAWASYQLNSRWKLGGGVQWTGARQAFRANRATPVPTLNGQYHPNTAPATQRWDAMLAYEQTRWTLRMNLKNVFDQTDYAAIYDNGSFLVPGGRRSVVLGADYHF